MSLLEENINKYDLNKEKDFFDLFITGILSSDKITNEKIITLIIKRYLKVISPSKDFKHARKFFKKLDKNISIKIQKKDKWKPIINRDINSVRNLEELAGCSAEIFYKSKAWLSFRFYILSKLDNKCNLCGSNDNLQVDHIKPRFIYPELAFVEDNMQILCKDCNFGKGLQKQIKEIKIKTNKKLLANHKQPLDK